MGAIGRNKPHFWKLDRRCLAAAVDIMKRHFSAVMPV